MRYLGMDIQSCPVVKVTSPATKLRDFVATLRSTMAAARDGFDTPVQLLQHLLGRALATEVYRPFMVGGLRFYGKVYLDLIF